MPRLPVITVSEVDNRGRPFMLRIPAPFSESGKIKRLFFTTLKAANAEKNRRDADIRENGRMGQLAPKDKALLTLMKTVGMSPSELLEAAQAWKLRPVLDQKAVPFSQLTTIFLDHHRNVRKSGTRHIDSLGYRLRAFSSKHGAVLSNALNPAQVIDYLEKIANTTTRRGHHQALSGLFNFAMERGFASISPLKVPGRIVKAPRIDYRTPDILGLQEAESVLEGAEGEIRAFLALGCFAGIRTREMIAHSPSVPVLDWADFDWAKSEIHIRREVAKKTRKRDNERWIPLNDTLRAWLEPLKQAEGRVVDTRWKLLTPWLQSLAWGAGLAKWPPNAPRHSFASYFLAAYPEKGAAALAQVMGNSETVARQHYVRALNQEEGLAYFALRPIDQPAATPQTEERS